MRQRRLIPSVAGLATTAVLTMTMALGAAPAGATSRLRSGALHVQLASHVSSGVGTGSGPLSLAGADVIALVVAVLAFVALAFVVVTLVRRRLTSA